MTDSASQNTPLQPISKKTSASSLDSSSESFNETQRIMVYLAQFENLDQVREFVGEAAQKCDLSASAVYAVQMAVDEAFSNIIEHAYGGECLEKIEVIYQISDAGLTVTLRDCGSPFDPTCVPDPDIQAELEERDIGGLGLYFIRQLMDEVDFTFARDPETGRRCNVLRMQKSKEK